MKLKLDERNRIVIPKKIIEELNIEKDLELRIENERIVLTNTSDKWNELKEYISYNLNNGLLSREDESAYEEILDKIKELEEK